MSGMFVILGLLSVCGWFASGQDTNQGCDIPAQFVQAAVAGESSVNFTFSQVADRFGLVLNTGIAEHIVEIENCSVTLYLLSEALGARRPTSGLSSEEISCFQMNADSVTSVRVASGTVIRFFSDEFNRPERLPESWFADERLIMRLSYAAFPPAPRMKCTLNVNLFLQPLEVQFDVEVGVMLSNIFPLAPDSSIPRTGGEQRGFADDSCYIPPNRTTASLGSSPMQFSLSSLRDSFGFLRGLNFTDQLYGVKEECGLALYAATIELPQIPVLGSLPLAGQTMTCFNLTQSGEVSQDEVARGRIIKFGTQSIPRPDSIPAAWFVGNRLIIDIKYDEFPQNVVQRMRCLYAVPQFSLEVWTDVTTTLVGCPETNWGEDCGNGCQCESGRLCHTFTGRCENDVVSPVTLSMTTPRRETTPVTETSTTLSTTVTTRTTTPRPTPDQCDILPREQLSVAGSSPIRFNFSEIEENIGLWDGVRIDDFLFDVQNCTLILYTRSPGVPRLAVDVQLAEEMVSCYDMRQGLVDMSSLRAQGTILKFLDQTVPRPAAVPESWYEGDRVVLQVVYNSFPYSQVQNMRCLFNFVALQLNLDVWVDVETTPVGCPETHWGKSCQRDCPCQNGGRCETFTGECVCLEGTSGISCENGISVEVTPPPDPLPTPSRAPLELTEGNSFAQCYPQFADPLAENQGKPEVSFSASPVQDSLALLESSNLRIVDQVYEIVNCSLTLFLRSSAVQPVLSVPLAGETLTCFELSSTLRLTTNQVATGTFLKFLRQAAPRPDPVPAEWYSGLNVVFQITYDSFPTNPLLTMRCSYTVPAVGLEIFIDIATRTSMLQLPRTTSATTLPAALPMTTSTTTTTTTTTARPTTTTTVRPTTTTARPTAVTTVRPTTPAVPPEIIISTVPSDPIVSTPDTTTVGSLDMRPEYRCYIPPHEPTPLMPDTAAVGQSPFNFTFSALQDTLGLLSNIRIEDHVFEVSNCSVTLYILTTPLPSLARNFQLVGETANCFLMQASAVITSTKLASGRVIKNFDQSLPRPAVVPRSWYEGDGLIAQIEYNSFPGVYPKTMKCTFSPQSVTNEISTEIETKAVGCPTSHWGPRCENECPCQNGGTCFTFQGGCRCREFAYGRLCETLIMPLSRRVEVNSRDLKRRNG